MAVRVRFAFRQHGSAKPMLVVRIRRVSGFCCELQNDHAPQLLPASGDSCQPAVTARRGTFFALRRWTRLRRRAGSDRLPTGPPDRLSTGRPSSQLLASLPAEAVPIGRAVV
ncbi:hypothetical protein CcI49_01950 [Frankia sp. CcI49]|nr:hypothetical protein CcI49_01950 [Frankia sp. CcI49]